MTATYHLIVRPGGKHLFMLKRRDGDIMLTSEDYDSKEAALNGIVSVRQHSWDGQHYHRKECQQGKPYFELKACNGPVIGTSEVYATESARELDIAFVKDSALLAEIDPGL